MEIQQTIDIHWDDELENLIKDECEICYSYYLLHNLAYIRYSQFNTYISLPVMILSTVTGATSMGSSVLFNNSNMASIGIGLIIILLNSLQAISSYYKFSQLSEGHKIASISFQKVSRYLEIELSLPRKERSTPKVILKILKNEIDRLLETSPIIQNVIIDQYNKKYKDDTAKKPAIVNGLKNVIINKDINHSPPPTPSINVQNTSHKHDINTKPIEQEINIVSEHVLYSTE